jgi:hypothetical protein
MVGYIGGPVGKKAGEQEKGFRQGRGAGENAQEAE